MVVGGRRINKTMIHGVLVWKSSVGNEQLDRLVLKRSILLQKANSFIVKHTFLYKCISNTDLRLKQSLTSLQKYLHRGLPGGGQRTEIPLMRRKKVCYLPQEVRGEVRRTGLHPC